MGLNPIPNLPKVQKANLDKSDFHCARAKMEILVKGDPDNIEPVQREAQKHSSEVRCMKISNGSQMR